ncbi:MAG: type II toxin-antitoxin system VapC family toxin [Gaiellaceae bacterium]
MYVDASAFLKLYLDEPEREECRELVCGASEPTTARLALVEVRRRLALELEGEQLAPARAQFARDWDEFTIVEVDDAACQRAAVIAEATGVRSLDALHLGAAEPLRGAVPFLTYDRRQADAARALGWTVYGA